MRALLDREHIFRVAREAPKTLRQIVCRKRDRAVLLTPDQILWFQVEDGIVKAHTAADTYWVNYQLAELEAGLPQETFFRARREVLVNLTRIQEIKPYFKSGFLLVMADQGATEIVVSERQATAAEAQDPRAVGRRFTRIVYGPEEESHAKTQGRQEYHRSPGFCSLPV